MWQNKLYVGHADDMTWVPESSVTLSITSPPYNVGKKYEQDMDHNEWIYTLEGYAEEQMRVLRPGGWIAVNIANTGRNPYVPRTMYVWQVLMGAGFIPRGEWIWNKGASVGSSCAWGSHCHPTAWRGRDVHEYILLAQKFGKLERQDRPAVIAPGGEWITSDDFTTWTKSIWDMQTVSSKRLGHPAPMPMELARRLILLCTYPGDVVLDPFNGSGTSTLTAQRLGRQWVGVDASAEYVSLAEEYHNGNLTRPDDFGGGVTGADV